MSPTTSRCIRIVKWLSVGAVALALLLFAWIQWTVARFDTKTLPAAWAG